MSIAFKLVHLHQNKAERSPNTHQSCFRWHEHANMCILEDQFKRLYHYFWKHQYYINFQNFLQFGQNFQNVEHLDWLCELNLLQTKRKTNKFCKKWFFTSLHIVAECCNIAVHQYIAVLWSWHCLYMLLEDHALKFVFSEDRNTSNSTTFASSNNRLFADGNIAEFCKDCWEHLFKNGVRRLRKEHQC